MHRVCFQLQVKAGRVAEFFVDLGNAKPDEGFLVLDEIFHLEDQIDSLDHGGYSRPKTD